MKGHESTTSVDNADEIFSCKPDIPEATVSVSSDKVGDSLLGDENTD